ncbi:MAG: hypothetical protein ABSG25_09605 [Bryobacteraceae bacterium]
MRVKELGNRPAPASVREMLSRLMRGHGPSVTVRRREIPYWQQQGWTQSGNRYSGSYQTAFGAFQGIADEHGRGFFRFYVHQPPREMERHGHWACFQNRGEGWYEVHMARMPRDIGSGIMSIERILSEALDR